MLFSNVYQTIPFGESLVNYEGIFPRDWKRCLGRILRRLILHFNFTRKVLSEKKSIIFSD